MSVAERTFKQFLEHTASERGDWLFKLDERTRLHVAWARLYASDFNHGAPGHLDLLTIAALAKLLDETHTPPDKKAG